MKRIDTPTAVADLNGLGKAGFRRSDLVAGIAATQFNPDWANNVQEEIANAIEGAGIALNGGSKTQLLAAINALVLGRFTGSNQQLSSNLWQKLPGGVLLQWGEISLPASGSNTAQVSVVYPISFPNGLAGPFAIPYESVNTGTGYTPIMRTLARTTAGFTMVGDTNNTVVFDKACKFGWFSIGF